MTEVAHEEKGKRETIAKAIARIDKVESKGELTDGERAMLGVIRLYLEDEGPTYNCARAALDVLAHVRAKMELEFKIEQERLRKRTQALDRRARYEAKARAKKDALAQLRLGKGE